MKHPQIVMTVHPFYISSCALLTIMVAKVCDLALGEFVHTLGDGISTTIILNRCKLSLLELLARYQS